RWLHEGIAQYAAGEFSEAQRRVIARAALDDRLLNIEQLDAAFAGDDEQVALAYAESYTLVAYLGEQRPAEGIGGLLDQLQRGRDMRLAMGLAFGRPVLEMEREWLESLQSGYLPAILPPVSDMLIGAGFVLSFLVALVVARRRSAAIRRRMEEQERLEAAAAEVWPVAGDEEEAE
ncbi:MAG: hypothetical protein J7M38_10520, partial [Armatimonadetes bacterium]|nr:hypothetical protein [Armatimonadota bacterium]